MHRLLAIVMVVVLAVVGCTLAATGNARAMWPTPGQPAAPEALPQQAVTETLTTTAPIGGAAGVTDTNAITGTGTLTATESISDTAQSSKKVGLLFFWAEWCGSCKKMQPLVDRIMIDYADTMAFKSVNVDEPGAKEWAQAYRVWAIPAFFLVRPTGEIIQQWFGEQPDGALRTAFNEALKS